MEKEINPWKQNTHKKFQIKKKKRNNTHNKNDGVLWDVFV